MTPAPPPPRPVVALLVDALRAARHALTVSHNLTATDLPHEYEDAMRGGCDPNAARDDQRDASWVLDHTAEIAQIDAALAEAAPADADAGRRGMAGEGSR